MGLKLQQLIDWCDSLHLTKPTLGTGKHGRIIRADYESVIGNYFADEIYGKDDAAFAHLQMRRACTPEKSFRFDKLNDDMRKSLMDHDDWLAEEKMNGWRMMFTYIPESGFMAWGGNISDVNCLPVNYTKHFVWDDLNLAAFANKDFDHPFILDCEATHPGPVEVASGFYAETPLECVGAIMGSGYERALAMQEKDGDVQVTAFDCIHMREVTNHLWAELCDVKIWSPSVRPLRDRKRLLEFVVSELINVPCVHMIESVTGNKKALLTKIFKDGGEGIILKNMYAPYTPGARLESSCVKVKRSMSGDIGDDLDVFISGYNLTKSWSAKGLIGSVVLSIHVDYDTHSEEREIATVGSMPDIMRKLLTSTDLHGKPTLNPDYKWAVLVVDGQELTGRNRKIQHARVDWNRGFREDKSSGDCTILATYLDEDKF